MSKNKEAYYNRTSTYVKRSSQDSGINNATMSSSNYIIHLQQTIGNQAVQRLMRSNATNDSKKTGIQTKLKVSQPGDVYEQEADRVAEQVVRTSDFDSIGSTPTRKEKGIDRKCSTCEMKKTEEEERMKNLYISRKPSTIFNLEVGKEATKEISNTRTSGGSSLDNNTQELMESRFGYDFSRVRIHTDVKAANSAESVNALAYTLGEDIVFGSGQYSPNTEVGRKLLAHEMTHVVQQSKTSGTASLNRSASKVKTKQNNYIILENVIQIKSQPSGDKVHRQPKEVQYKLDVTAQAILQKAADAQKEPDDGKRAVNGVWDILKQYYPTEIAKVAAVVYEADKIVETEGVDIKGGLPTKGKIIVGKSFLNGITQPSYFAHNVVKIGHELKHIDQYIGKPSLYGDKYKNEREFLAFYWSAFEPAKGGTGKIGYGTRRDNIDCAIGFFYCLNAAKQAQYKLKKDQLISNRIDINKEAVRHGHPDSAPPIDCSVATCGPGYKNIKKDS